VIGVIDVIDVIGAIGVGVSASPVLCGRFHLPA